MKKRIALAAVAALAGGLLVAAPASAVVGSFTGSATSATVGGFANVVFEAQNDTATAQHYTVSVSTGSITALAGETSTAYVVGSTTPATLPATTVKFVTDDDASVIDTASATHYLETITVTAPAAGAQVITINEVNSNTGAVVATYVHTITWIAPTIASTVVSATYSSIDTITGTTWPTGAAKTAVTTDVFTGVGATLKVKSTDNAALVGQVVRAVVSGPGLVSFDDSTYGRDVSALLTSTNTTRVYLRADGTAGTNSIALYAGGVLIGSTPDVVFHGDLAKLTVTQQFKTAAAGETLGTADDTDYAVSIAGADADGNVYPLEQAKFTATSSDAAVIAGVAGAAVDTGVYYASVKGAANAVSGANATLTFKYTYTTLAGLAATLSTDAVTFAIGGAVAKVTMTLDKDTYEPGAKATLTVKAVDDKGNAVGGDADGAIAALASVESNFNASGLASSFEVVDGVATATIYAPVAAGTWTIVGEDTTDAAAAVSVSAKVAAPVDANITAMNAKVVSTEATVAALQVTVASVIKSLKVQWWLLKKIAVKVGIKLG